MGLLELLQQGQTTLSAGSFPGDAPINDPQSGFVQDNSIYNSYEDETIGQPNNGSKLANTLDDTALDITDFDSNSNNDSPTWDWVTDYPPLVSGEFNGAPNTYELLYNANNTYLDSVSIQTPDSPQLNTLNQTGLDNIDNTAEETTIIPNSISYPNNYPALVSGKFDGAPEQYDTPYNLDNTYLDNIPIQTEDSPQIPTLSEINPPTSYGNPTNYPSSATGQWRGASNEFIAPWSYGYQYKDNLFNNLNYVKQQDTLDKTSLDNTNAGNIQTTVPNPNSIWTSYPSLVKGRFNNAPYQFTPPYNTFNLYLDNVPIQTSNSPQLNTLDNTGLDNTNSNADETTFIPNSNTSPNNYPEIESVNLGSLNGAPNSYQSLYTPNNTYLENVSNDVDSIETNILGQTGLDNSNLSSAQTAITPNSITYPTSYPALVSGEFNNAASQYNTPYNYVNTYLNNVPIQNVNSPQLNTLDETGLDNTDNESVETTIIPDSLTYPNNYPSIQNVSLGAFNGAPSQYESLYTPNNTYLDAYNTVTNDDTNPLNNNLNLSGLDNTYPFESSPTAEIPTDSTIYPVFSTGQWQGAPQLFTQNYGPSANQYYPPFAFTSDTDVLSQQYDSLSKTGLDVDNENAVPTTNIIANPDSITVYPASNVTSVTGSAPQPFNQIWKPTKRYYDDYAKSLKDQSLV